MLHPDLWQAVEDLGIKDQVPTLAEAATHSRDTLAAAHNWLHERVPSQRAEELDVVVHGSFARGEATPESDFDYLVVAHGVPTDVRVMRDMLSAVDEFIRTKLSAGDETADRRPGRTGIFGHIASAPDLTERIGLEQDTNVSTTRRLLHVIPERYLSDYEDHAKPGVPRFLLNDVVRYWYTPRSPGRARARRPRGPRALTPNSPRCPR